MNKNLLVILLLFISVALQSAIKPTANEKYYILQTATLSGKVIGNTVFNEVVLNDAINLEAQLFEFIPVPSKSDTYYIKNSAGYYLVNSIDVNYLAEYTTDLEGNNCEWVIEGTSLSAIRLKVNSSAYLSTNTNLAGTMLVCDKTATDANGIFKLVPQSEMLQNNMVDGGFENAIVEGAPIGFWQNDNNKLLGNDNATTQIYRSRIINNGYQCTGSNAFLLRFYGDANSYTKISHKLTGLTKGATYKFDYKYKQSNVMTADATVSSYIAIKANDVPSAALSNVFTSTPPSTTAATQAIQSASLSFIATATEMFVVFAKNPASSSNFLQYIDDMRLTKTIEATTQIHCSDTVLVFNDLVRKLNVNVTGVLLSDSIRITVPTGIKVSSSVLSPTVNNVLLNVEFTGFSAVNDKILLTSGTTVKQISVTANYSSNFVSPQPNEFYFLQQRTGGKVVAKASDTQKAALRFAEKNDKSQMFEFIPVQPKQNVFLIKNADNKYLTASAAQLEYTISNSAMSEWVLQGDNDSLVYITQASNSAKVIGSDSIVNNSSLYVDKLKADVNSAFCLQKASVLNPGYFFDAGFENNPADGGPLGTWIPNNDPVQLGMYGYSRVQASAWAASGKKCMYLRFLGEATSYTSISQKLYGLVPGATYRFDFKYKCQSTSATSLVNIFAASAVNAPKSAALGGFYTSTVVAASNLATQLPQNASLTFVAPTSTVYIVYSKNTSTTNFNFFIDDLVLTETIPSAVINQHATVAFNAYFLDDKLLINFESVDNSLAEIEIMNIQGQILKKEKIECLLGMNNTAIVNNLSAGIYLVRLTKNNKCLVNKTIKQ